MGSGKLSIDERQRNISDYYIAFKIEINKEYFLMNPGPNSKQRKGSAKLISINQTNAFNFNLESKKSNRNSIMNTSIDQIKRKGKSREFGEILDVNSVNSDIDKKKLSGFFMEPVKASQFKEEETDMIGYKKTVFFEQTKEVQFNFNYNIPSDIKMKKLPSRPRFSLDVNEYPHPKKMDNENPRNNQNLKIPKSNPINLKTNIALYDNKIMEESISRQETSKIFEGEETISSKVNRTSMIRSNSFHRGSRQSLDKYNTSMLPGRSNSNNSFNSNENGNLNSLQKIKPLENPYNLGVKPQPDIIKNKSMLPKRQFSRLHQSNNILPNSEDIRHFKVRPKASLQSNVPFIRFQNYQTIASLKSEMNLQSKKNNYKKKQRQVMQNFRHPQNPLGELQPTFKSNSSIESGDSDQELNLEKAYCNLCGDDFR